MIAKREFVFLLPDNKLEAVLMIAQCNHSAMYMSIKTC